LGSLSDSMISKRTKDALAPNVVAQSLAAIVA
jgi:hypothetical protein